VGRKKTSEALKDARGSYLRHPERKRKAEPSPQSAGELGAPPSRLSKEERSVWKELAQQFAGVLGASDRQNFEKLVKLEAKSREDFFGMRVGDRAMLIKLTTHFEERARAVAPKPESKLDSFLARGTQMREAATKKIVAGKEAAQTEAD
jgi:hypothetical protein